MIQTTSHATPGAHSRVRNRLLAGAALIACAPGVAWAQAETDPAPPDGLGDRGVYMEADTLTRANDGALLTATGLRERVLARFQGRTLRAQEVSYDLNQGIATAAGQAELINPDGTVVYADRLELDEDLTTGVAVNIATQSADGGRLMAATAVRRSETVNELNYAIFTPCPICDDEGQPKTPSWSIQAQQVIQNEELRAVLYRNAVFRLGGVPVFYLPYFAHPDPTVERASGFLSPRVDYNDPRGLSYEQPYLFVLSPSQDLVVSPQFNTRVAPMLNVQWRRRFDDGLIVARAGYTNERNFGDFDVDGDGTVDKNVRFGPREDRSYLLAYGAFDPEGPWRWGFTAERVSDKTLFDRYDTDDPYQDHGLYLADRRRLISQIYAERQTDRSYFSAAAFSIQSLRVQIPNPIPALNQFEKDGVIPLVAPLIELRYEPQQEIFGGRLRLHGSAVALTRSDYVGAPVLRPDQLPLPRLVAGDPAFDGVDSRRASLEAEWRRVLIAPAGVRYEPFIEVRGDAYSVEDLPAGDTVEVGRGRATIGIDLSYPLIRRFGGGDLVLEPMAQLLASSGSGPDSRLPNEDSQIVDLDEASLFRTDRFPGQDLYENGVRLTLGGRASMRWGDGRHASLFVGRSLRDEREDAFLIEEASDDPTTPADLYDPTGLAERASDWIVAATFAPTDRIRGWGHAQVDSNGNIRRAEATVDAGWGKRNLASLQYIVDRSDPGGGAFNRNYEFVQLAGQQFVHGDWGVTGRIIGDLETDTITRAEIGVLFEDDCLRLEIGYRRDNTRVDPSGPRSGMFIRLNLATFGGSGYGDDDMR
jgi:LPS-assembly protein